MERPNWQTNFKDLPSIPEHKRWLDDQHYTKEQEISYKLLRHQQITKEEEQIFIQLKEFYQELDDKLDSLDYDSFDSTDIENFKNYIFYAFNYQPLISNKITLFKTYRLVVNEWVINKNERITDIKYLKYPELDIVQDIGKYNRANSPNSNVFYSTQSIDNALKEINPPLNKKITVGVWAPKKEKKFVSYPISHSEAAFNINESVKKATEAVENYSTQVSELFVSYTKYYFKLLGKEFAKPVKHHLEYILTAWFSERILQNRSTPQPSFNFDCIIYPSVGNDLRTDNFAFLPEVVDNDLRLDGVYEFEIEEAYYNEPLTYDHDPQTVRLAKLKNVQYAKGMASENLIEW